MLPVNCSRECPHDTPGTKHWVLIKPGSVLFVLYSESLLLLFQLLDVIPKLGPAKGSLDPLILNNLRCSNRILSDFLAQTVADDSHPPSKILDLIKTLVHTSHSHNCHA